MTNIGQDSFAELDEENKGWLPIKVSTHYNNGVGGSDDDDGDGDDDGHGDDDDDKDDDDGKKTANCFRSSVDC